MKKLVLMSLVLFCGVLNSFGQVEIFPLGSEWKYNDLGVNLKKEWRDVVYEDATWASGLGEFGYGDADETTELCLGVNLENRKFTTYFRKTVSIADVNAYEVFDIKYKRDDAIVVYVNGVEIFRNNFKESVIQFWIPAKTPMNGVDENEFLVDRFTLAASKFVNGNNVIAVEIHEAAGPKEDVSFDMSLIGYAAGSVLPVIPTPTIVSERPAVAVVTSAPVNTPSPTIVRGPYLQIVTGTSATIHWQSTTSYSSKVQYGTDITALTDVIDPTVTIDHAVQLTGLTPGTKYYYTIGSETDVYQGDENNYFLTSPVKGETGKYTFWVAGDCGTGKPFQANVLNRYNEYMDGKPTNGWLLLGDNAYGSGTEQDYTDNFFGMYQNSIMKNAAIWPVPGNHDYSNGKGISTTSRDFAYYNVFNLPKNGEAGGVPSTKEAYYSYDYGNVHFIALDSYGQESGQTRLYDTLGEQMQWVKADLAANTLPWVIAYWHHAPFTKGSHNSDAMMGKNDYDLTEIRQKTLRVLERLGVDLVMCGHSHNYERSKLMHGFYGKSNEFDGEVYNLSQSSGKYDGSENSCVYLKDEKNESTEGTVYVVAGSSGKVDPTEVDYPHHALPFADASNGGSLILEIEDNRLDAKFLCLDGVVRDNFSIIKNSSKKDTVTVNAGESVSLSASWIGTYSWETGASTARSVSISPTESYMEVVTDEYNCVSDSIYVKVIGHVTGVNEVNESTSDLKLFPVPTTSELNIVTENVNVKSYEISTLTGQVVLAGLMTKQHVIVNVSSLAKGSYLVRVKDENNVVASQVIIVE